MGGPSRSAASSSSSAAAAASSSTSASSSAVAGKKRNRSINSNSNMWNSSGTSRSSKSSKNNRKSNAASSSTINETAAEKLFTELLSEEDDPTSAGMEGISQLCEQLNMDPLEDIRILVLLWKLGSKEKPAQISKDEWMSGCHKLQVDSIDKFQALLPSLDTGFLDQSEFRDFYKFCFRFNLHSTHRTLDKEMVVALMKMVLKGRIPDERMNTFCTFVEAQTSYTRITLDQWTSFLDFCYECDDLSTYDESSSAWPVLIDEYVEFMMEEQQKKK